MTGHKLRRHKPRLLSVRALKQQHCSFHWDFFLCPLLCGKVSDSQRAFKTKQRQSSLSTKKELNLWASVRKAAYKITTFHVKSSCTPPRSTKYSSLSTLSEWNSKFLAVQKRLGEEKLDQIQFPAAVLCSSVTGHGTMATFYLVHATCFSTSQEEFSLGKNPPAGSACKQ